MKEENLKNAVDKGTYVHKNVHFLVGSDPPYVIKRLKADETVDEYLHFYEEMIRLGIATPQIISVDKQNNLIKCGAIGIGEKGSDGKYHSQTLVDFSRHKEKDEDIIEFLERTIRYALSHNWTDLHSGNILHQEGSLYLVDYVPKPGRGKHRPGALGLPRIRERADSGEKAASNEIERLRANGFDELLERAIDRINDMSVCRDGIEAIRK